jgi:HNH endonuclease
MTTKYDVPYPFVVRRSGKIQSCKRLRPQTGNSVNIAKDGFTAIPYEDEEGFLMINLMFHHNHRQYVHRLVAEKYLPNPEGYAHVIFKDGDRKNCEADNLEWCE